MNVGGLVGAVMGSPESFDFDRCKRWSATTCTWMKKMTALAQYDTKGGNPHVAVLVGYEAARVLNTVLFESEILVALISDADVEEAERHAKDVVSALRRRRLAVKLADTTGRTPEEAAEFRGKAEKLGG